MAIHTNHSSGPTGGKYEWDHVKVKLPNGSYVAYIFSPLLYEETGAWNVTGYTCSRGINRTHNSVSYLFAKPTGFQPYGTGPGQVPSNGFDPNATWIGYNDPLYGGVPYSMWGPGMPMEGVFPDVGDIVKITDLNLDHDDTYVWKMPSHPWNEPLHSHSGVWPLTTTTPAAQDWLCLQVIAVITKQQFDSNDIFIPTQSSVAISNGPQWSPITPKHQCLQKDPPYTSGGGSITEGCHYHDRPLTVNGIPPHNVTHGGISDITLYMKPNSNWVSSTGGGLRQHPCYNICATRASQDTMPTIPGVGVHGILTRKWVPIISGVDADICGIYEASTTHGNGHSGGNASNWNGYTVPYTGRYSITYEAQLKIDQNGWKDQARWYAMATINGKLITHSGLKSPDSWADWTNGGNGGSWTSNICDVSIFPSGPCGPPWWVCGPYTGDINPLPTHSAGGFSNGPCTPHEYANRDFKYSHRWKEQDCHAFSKGHFQFDINLEKGDKVQIFFYGTNENTTRIAYTKIRNQKFCVKPAEVNDTLNYSDHDKRCPARCGYHTLNVSWMYPWSTCHCDGGLVTTSSGIVWHGGITNCDWNNGMEFYEGQSSLYPCEYHQRTYSVPRKYHGSSSNVSGVGFYVHGYRLPTCTGNISGNDPQKEWHFEDAVGITIGGQYVEQPKGNYYEAPADVDPNNFKVKVAVDLSIRGWPSKKANGNNANLNNMHWRVRIRLWRSYDNSFRDWHTDATGQWGASTYYTTNTSIPMCNANPGYWFPFYRASNNHQNGDPDTGIKMKPGDRLWVQVKVPGEGDPHMVAMYGTGPGGWGRGGSLKFCDGNMHRCYPYTNMGLTHHYEECGDVGGTWISFSTNRNTSTSYVPVDHPPYHTYNPMYTHDDRFKLSWVDTSQKITYLDKWTTINFRSTSPHNYRNPSRVQSDNCMTFDNHQCDRIGYFDEIPPDALCPNATSGGANEWNGTTTIYPPDGCNECLKIPSWDCDMSTYGLPITTDSPEFWRINGKGCVDPGDGTGIYTTFDGLSNSCRNDCNPPWWDCDGNGTCLELTTEAPPNAYMSLAVCQANCVKPSWDCDSTQGICYDPGTGLGQYTSLPSCQANCSTISYDCMNGNCIAQGTSNGQYTSLSICQANCFVNSWNCINQSCIDPNDGTGTFPLLQTCIDICSAVEPCDTYFTVSDDGTLYHYPGTSPVWTKKLYYYDAVNNSTTYILDLPLNSIPTLPTAMQTLDDGIANTDTKLWAWGYETTATTESVIVEYDIITQTSLVYNRTIRGINYLGQDIPIENLNIGNLSAINDKTLIALSGAPETYCSDCGPGIYLNKLIACKGDMSPFYLSGNHPWIVSQPLNQCTWHCCPILGITYIPEIPWYDSTNDCGLMGVDGCIMHDLTVNYGPYQDVREVHFQSGVECTSSTHPDCCGPAVGPGGMLSSGKKYQKIDYISSYLINGGQHYYTWASFMDAIHVAGVPCIGCCGVTPCTTTQHIDGHFLNTWDVGIEVANHFLGSSPTPQPWFTLGKSFCVCATGCVSSPPIGKSMVLEIDVHPVIGPSIEEQFLVDTVGIGDTYFWRQKDVLFTTSPGPLGLYNSFGTVNKYDYSTGTLLNSVPFTPNGGDVGTIRGLAMSKGNLYAYADVLSNKKYLINKQTLVQTYLGTDTGNLPMPYNATIPPVQFASPGYSWQYGTGAHQGGIQDASSSPCCEESSANCAACAQSLSTYLVNGSGSQIDINFIAYDPTVAYVTYGDCVSDPGGCCKCCTYATSNAPLAPPSNASSRIYATTLSYVEGETSRTKERVTHIEEIKRWFADPINKFQDVVWNTTYFAKRNHEHEKVEKEDNFEGISLFSLTISVRGISHTFEDSSTWSDVIKHSIHLGAKVSNSMTWDRYIKEMYSHFGTIEFLYSVSDISLGIFELELTGPFIKPTLPCQIINGEYIDFVGMWRDCDVNIHGDPCTGDTMNWGCCGGSFLGPTYHPYICDNKQGTCPSGCANIDTGYVGNDTESFFAWYAFAPNGFYATDIRTLKYLLNTRTQQIAHPCYEPALGWWYNFAGGFTLVGSWVSTGIVSTHFTTVMGPGNVLFNTWLQFITVLFSNGFSTANLGLSFTQLLNYQYIPLINKLKLLQPGFDLVLPESPCHCDQVECVQNVPKPDGYLTKAGCQNSAITDCPFSDQRCTPDPWRCIKKQVPMPDGPAGQNTVGPYYKCFCVQKEATAYNQITYATEELCKQAKNCCLPETYNCKSSISDCVGKNLLPHIVGQWWDGVQATNIITFTPVATSTELFGNAIFGQQSTDIRDVRWEYSWIQAQSSSSFIHDCLPTSPLANTNPPLSPWITVTGLEFKDPFESNNINNTLGLPGLPVYTWSDYIFLLNSYGVGTVITPSMSAFQVGSIIQNYMGWGSITFGVSWRRCVCNPSTTSCSCVDPGDGSGTYSSLYGCQTAPFSCCGSMPN